MTKNIVIIGGGGVAREAHDVLEAVNADGHLETGIVPFNFLGFVAPRNEHSILLVERGPLLGGDEVMSSLPAGTSYVIGIGEGSLRSKLASRAEQNGLIPATLVHPLASIGKYGNIIGEGSLICAFASLTTSIVLGRHVFIDRNVTVGHDTILSDYVSIYPSASISGNVTIGMRATIGTGARVIQGLTLGNDSFLGAGAVATRHVPAGMTSVGVPAVPVGQQ